MKKSNLSDFTIPFIPQQIVTLSWDDIQIFESGFEVKWKSNLTPTSDLIGETRIINQEWLLILENNIQTMLIQWVFTKTIPINQSLKKYLRNYLSSHPLKDKHWERKHISMPRDTIMKVIQQDHLDSEALQHTANQFKLKIAKPIQYQTIIKARMEHNNQQWNSETGEC